MPYYDGRWHIYSEQQRRAFGERRRDELSKQWHAKWISKSGLKERLWTDKAIADFLGKPRDAGTIMAWARKEVVKAEQNPGFVAWLNKRRAGLIRRGKLPKHHQIEPLDGFPDNVIKISRARNREE